MHTRHAPYALMPIQFQDYFVLSVKFIFYVKDVAKIIYCGEKKQMMKMISIMKKIH